MVGFWQSFIEFHIQFFFYFLRCYGYKYSNSNFNTKKPKILHLMFWLCLLSYSKKSYSFFDTNIHTHTSTHKWNGIDVNIFLIEIPSNFSMVLDFHIKQLQWIGYSHLFLRVCLFHCGLYTNFGHHFPLFFCSMCSVWARKS